MDLPGGDDGCRVPQPPVRGALHSPPPFVVEVAGGARLAVTDTFGGALIMVTTPGGDQAEIMLPRFTAARVAGLAVDRMTRIRVGGGTGHVLP